MKKRKRFLRGSNCRGFTLAELLMALMVSSVIMAAVASLAYAFGASTDSTNDTVRKQAQVRCATIRISDLIRYSRLICMVISKVMCLFIAAIGVHMIMAALSGYFVNT